MVAAPDPFLMLKKPSSKVCGNEQLSKAARTARNLHPNDYGLGSMVLTNGRVGTHEPLFTHKKRGKTNSIKPNKMISLFG